MLWFVGLGLWDLEDVSLRGRRLIMAADRVFLEGYTSVLVGTDHAAMEQTWGREVTILGREDVENRPDALLEAARDGTVAFCVPGDPMVSTTHIDLRLRARELGIPTGIVHGASIATAVAGLAGLQNYRFGRSCSLPFPHGSWRPSTPAEVVRQNLEAGLHTLVYLDIQKDRYMRISEAIDLLEELSASLDFSIDRYIGVARAGSPAPVVAVGTSDEVRAVDFGGPLHILVVPGPLHPMEEEYLDAFARP
ncbi:MAG: diphthine synthase [Methanoregulaceae archaeon]